MVVCAPCSCFIWVKKYLKYSIAVGTDNLNSGAVATSFVLSNKISRNGMSNAMETTLNTVPRKLKTTFPMAYFLYGRISWNSFLKSFKTKLYSGYENTVKQERKYTCVWELIPTSIQGYTLTHTPEYHYGLFCRSLQKSYCYEPHPNLRWPRRRMSWYWPDQLG